MLRIIAITMLLAITGCSSARYAGWPIEEMKDPVTEEQPDVIHD